jgi:hypothetical protein
MLEAVGYLPHLQYHSKLHLNIEGLFGYKNPMNMKAACVSLGLFYSEFLVIHTEAQIHHD